jgi:hypothetical protein
LEDYIEANLKLKEEIAVLEKAYKELMEAYQKLYFVPDTIHGTIKTISLMCHEQIKAQRGEKSLQVKFESTEKFADYLGMMADIMAKYLEDKFKIYNANKEDK